MKIFFAYWPAPIALVIALAAQGCASTSGSHTTSASHERAIYERPLPPAVETLEDLVAVKCNLCNDRKTLNPPGSKTQK